MIKRMVIPHHGKRSERKKQKQGNVAQEESFEWSVKASLMR